MPLPHSEARQPTNDPAPGHRNRNQEDQTITEQYWASRPPRRASSPDASSSLWDSRRDKSGVARLGFPSVALDSNEWAAIRVGRRRPPWRAGRRRDARPTRGRLHHWRRPSLSGGAPPPAHPNAPARITLSPCHLVTLSPCHLVPFAPILPSCPRTAPAGSAAHPPSAHSCARRFCGGKISSCRSSSARRSSSAWRWRACRGCISFRSRRW